MCLRGAFGMMLRETASRAAICAHLRAESAAAGQAVSPIRPRPFVFRAAHLDGADHPRRLPPSISTCTCSTPGIPPARLFTRLTRASPRPASAPAADAPPWSPSATNTSPFALDAAHESAARVRVQFLTPTELKSGQQLVTRPEFPILFARLRDRISTLRALYGPGPLDIDFRAMGERAAARAPLPLRTRPGTQPSAAPAAPAKLIPSADSPARPNIRRVCWRSGRVPPLPARRPVDRRRPPDRLGKRRNMFPALLLAAKTYTLPPDKLAKAIAYAAARNRLHFIAVAYGILVLVALLAWRVAPRLRNFAESATRRRILQAYIFAPLLLLAIDAAGTAALSLRPSPLAQVRPVHPRLGLLVLGLDQRRIARLRAGRHCHLGAVWRHAPQPAPLVVLLLAGVCAHGRIPDVHRAAGHRADVLPVRAAGRKAARAGRRDREGDGARRPSKSRPIACSK